MHLAKFKEKKRLIIYVPTKLIILTIDNIIIVIIIITI